MLPPSPHGSKLKLFWFTVRCLSLLPRLSTKAVRTLELPPTPWQLMRPLPKLESTGILPAHSQERQRHLDSNLGSLGDSQTNSPKTQGLASGTRCSTPYTGAIVSTVFPNLVPSRSLDDLLATHFIHWKFCDLLLSSLWGGKIRQWSPSLFIAKHAVLRRTCRR